MKILNNAVCEVCGSEMSLRGHYPSRGYSVWNCRKCRLDKELGLEEGAPFDPEGKDNAIRIRMYQGFGDNLYLRGHIGGLIEKGCRVWIDTPYPELFEGEGVHYLRQKGFYRFAGKEADSVHFEQGRDNYGRTIDVYYAYGEMGTTKTITQAYDLFNTFEQRHFELAVKDKWVEEAKVVLEAHGLDLSKPFTLIKPPTIRDEWVNVSRNPEPSAWNLAQRFAVRNSEQTVSLAYIDDGVEHYDCQAPEGVTARIESHVSYRGIIGIFALAEKIIATPSFAIPLSLALKKPAFIIYGGSVPNSQLVDSRMDTSNYHFIEPQPFCQCHKLDHECGKEIDGKVLRAELRKFLLG